VSSLDASPAPSKVKCWLAGGLSVLPLLMILLYAIDKMTMRAGSLPIPRERMARETMRQIGEAVRMFRLCNRRWPTVADLTTPDTRGNVCWEPPFTDPWGHEYVLRLGNDDNSWVLSLGPDGVAGTADDLAWPVR
jgi:hypothetical protein